MSTPHLNETAAFVAVLEHKSFSKAAKQLSLSPARVSELIRSIEAQLGVRLVERTTRSVAPTEAGERLLARLRPALDEYQSAFDALNDFRTKPAGTLRLTIPPPAAEFILAPVVARFMAEYPDITLDVSVDGILRDIVAERFDAGIRLGERVARDMIAVRISDPIPLVVVAAPAYLARWGAPKTPHELPNHNCMRMRFPSGLMLPWRFSGKNRRNFEVQVGGSFVGNSDLLVLQSVRDGAGLFQFPLPYVAADLAAGRLVTVLDEWRPPPSDGFYLYYSSRRQVRPALKVFVDFMRNARRGKS